MPGPAPIRGGSRGEGLSAAEHDVHRDLSAAAIAAIVLSGVALGFVAYLLLRCA